MQPSSPRPKMSHLGTYALLVVVCAALLFVLYVYIRLHWSYSDGERSGILQKASSKGWICRTFEGELAMSYTPGLAPQIWNFSVRDPEVAKQVNEATGKKVVLHYKQHPGVPTDCFGETEYFVDGVRIVQ